MNKQQREDMRAYLPEGLPSPLPARDGLDKQYWQGLSEEKLKVQRCNTCQREPTRCHDA